MLRFLFYFTSLSFFLFSSTAFSLVDMKNANFSDYWVDIAIPDSTSFMKISRTYSSRSLFSGIFGFGWCSQIESRLEITIEGNLILNECGSGVTNFYPANSNTQLINATIEKIISSLKKTEASKNKKYFDDLKERLRLDHHLRTRYAGDAGVRVSPIKNTVFLLNGKDLDKITFDGSVYLRTSPEGVVQKFDGYGKLVYLSDRYKNFMRLTYTAGLINQISDGNGNKFLFNYTLEKKVKQISSGGLAVLYKFNGENLVQTTNAWQNTYAYEYDNNHNLTKINFPDGTTKMLSYTESKDWVREFRDRDGCVETYEFTLSQENPKDHYWSTAVKNCKGKTAYKHRYEFWYQTRPDKEKYLGRVVSEKNNQTLDISYHPELGKPISIRKNSDITTFQYLNNGFLKQKTVSLFFPQADETNKYSLLFDYDSEWRIESTTTEFYNKTGKSLRKKKTFFKYDNANRLTLAKTSEGQFVEIKYNAQGLIVGLADQTKKEVLIEYDAKTQRPTSIARPEVGSLQLTYAATGELKKINNKGGSSTTSQIYSTFNNFIDMVGPISAELSLNL